MSKVIVNVSARHVHLSEKDIQTLFGASHKLEKRNDLLQPGQFACSERVDIRGPKSTIKNVIVLGPARPQSQAEISMTDARTLGLTAPVRESGDLAGSTGVTLVGPAGEVELSEGLIVAMRHIHLHTRDAEEFGLENKQLVDLRLDTARPLVLCDVVVRVSDSYAAEAHIDTDEANAAGCPGNVYGEIIKK